MDFGERILRGHSQDRKHADFGVEYTLFPRRKIHMKSAPKVRRIN